MSDDDSSGVKRPTNLSARADLIDAARRAGVNLSALLERALVEELAHRKRLQWRAEHLQAIVAYNDHFLRQCSCRATRRSGRCF